MAAVSGDVRRCLELLRRAAEITEAKTKQAAASDAAEASSSGQARPTGHTLTGIAPALLSHAVLAYNFPEVDYPVTASAPRRVHTCALASASQ